MSFHDNIFFTLWCVLCIGNQQLNMKASLFAKIPQTITTAIDHLHTLIIDVVLRPVGVRTACQHDMKSVYFLDVEQYEDSSWTNVTNSDLHL